MSLVAHDDWGEFPATGHVARHEDAAASPTAIRAPYGRTRIEMRRGADAWAVYEFVRRPGDATGDGEYMAALASPAVRRGGYRAGSAAERTPAREKERSAGERAKHAIAKLRRKARAAQMHGKRERSSHPEGDLCRDESPPMARVGR